MNPSPIPNYLFSLILQAARMLRQKSN